MNMKTNYRCVKISQERHHSLMVSVSVSKCKCKCKHWALDQVVWVRALDMVIVHSRSHSPFLIS